MPEGIRDDFRDYLSRLECRSCNSDRWCYLYKRECPNDVELMSGMELAAGNCSWKSSKTPAASAVPLTEKCPSPRHWGSVPGRSVLSLFMKAVKCLIVINAIAMQAWYPVDPGVVEFFG